MRAKEYANRFSEGMTDKEFKDTLTETIIDFISEIETITKSRNIQTDSGLLSVIKEQDEKWQSLSKKVLGINLYGFRDFIVIKIPETKTLLGW